MPCIFRMAEEMELTGILRNFLNNCKSAAFKGVAWKNEIGNCWLHVGTDPKIPW